MIHKSSHGNDAFTNKFNAHNIVKSALQNSVVKNESKIINTRTTNFQCSIYAVCQNTKIAKLFLTS